MKLDFSKLPYELTLENLLELQTFIIDSFNEPFASPAVFDAQAFFPVIDWAKRTISPREVELLLRDSQVAVESLPRLPSEEVSPLQLEKDKLLSFFNLLWQVFQDKQREASGKVTSLEEREAIYEEHLRQAGTPTPDEEARRRWEAYLSETQKIASVSSKHLPPIPGSETAPEASASPAFFFQGGPKTRETGSLSQTSPEQLPSSVPAVPSSAPVRTEQETVVSPPPPWAVAIFQPTTESVLTALEPHLSSLVEVVERYKNRSEATSQISSRLIQTAGLTPDQAEKLAPVIVDSVSSTHSPVIQRVVSGLRDALSTEIPFVLSPATSPPSFSSATLPSAINSALGAAIAATGDLGISPSQALLSQQVVVSAFSQHPDIPHTDLRKQLLAQGLNDESATAISHAARTAFDFANSAPVAGVFSAIPAMPVLRDAVITREVADIITKSSSPTEAVTRVTDKLVADRILPSSDATAAARQFVDIAVSTVQSGGITEQVITALQQAPVYSAAPASVGAVAPAVFSAATAAGLPADKAGQLVSFVAQNPAASAANVTDFLKTAAPSFKGEAAASLATAVSAAAAPAAAAAVTPALRDVATARELTGIIIKASSSTEAVTRVTDKLISDHGFSPSVATTTARRYVAVAAATAQAGGKSEQITAALQQIPILPATTAISPVPATIVPPAFILTSTTTASLSPLLAPFGLPPSAISAATTSVSEVVSTKGLSVQAKDLQPILEKAGLSPAAASRIATQIPGYLQNVAPQTTSAAISAASGAAVSTTERLKLSPEISSQTSKLVSQMLATNPNATVMQIQESLKALPLSQSHAVVIAKSVHSTYHLAGTEVPVIITPPPAVSSVSPIASKISTALPSSLSAVGLKLDHSATKAVESVLTNPSLTPRQTQLWLNRILETPAKEAGMSTAQATQLLTTQVISRAGLASEYTSALHPSGAVSAFSAGLDQVSKSVTSLQKDLHLSPTAVSDINTVFRSEFSANPLITAEELTRSLPASLRLTPKQASTLAAAAHSTFQSSTFAPAISPALQTLSSAGVPAALRVPILNDILQLPSQSFSATQDQITLILVKYPISPTPELVSSLSHIVHIYDPGAAVETKALRAPLAQYFQNSPSLSSLAGYAPLTPDLVSQISSSISEKIVALPASSPQARLLSAISPTLSFQLATRPEATLPHLIDLYSSTLPKNTPLSSVISEVAPIIAPLINSQPVLQQIYDSSLSVLSRNGVPPEMAKNLSREIVLFKIYKPNATPEEISQQISTFIPRIEARSLVSDSRGLNSQLQSILTHFQLQPNPQATVTQGLAAKLIEFGHDPTTAFNKASLLSKNLLAPYYLAGFTPTENLSPEAALRLQQASFGHLLPYALSPSLLSPQERQFLESQSRDIFKSLRDAYGQPQNFDPQTHFGPDRAGLTSYLQSFTNPLPPYARQPVQYLFNRFAASGYGQRFFSSSIGKTLTPQISRFLGVSFSPGSMATVSHLSFLERFNLGLTARIQSGSPVSRFISNSVNKGFQKLASSTTGKAVAKVASKVLSKAALQALGSVVPVVGNAIAFVVGEVLGKVVEKILDKIKPLLKALFLIQLAPLLGGLALGGLALGAGLGAVAGLGAGAVGALGGSAFSASIGGSGGTMATNFASGFSRFSGQISRLSTTVLFDGLKNILLPALAVPAVVALFVYIITSSAVIVPGPIPSSVSGGNLGPDSPQCWPTRGTITQGPPERGTVCYGIGGNVVTCSHAAYDLNGIDIANGGGTEIYATHNGTAQVIYSSTGYGNHVILTSVDGSFTTVYGHFDNIVISEGAVSANTLLGYMNSTGNSTGNHLHYELRSSTGASVDSIVPVYDLYGQTEGCFAGPGQ